MRGYSEITDQHVLDAMVAAENGVRAGYDVQVADGLVDLNSAPGWVYFIVEAGDKHLKIGWAGNPIERLRDLQVAHPLTLRIIGIIPGVYSNEASFHRVFRDHRVGGEWFRYKPLKAAVDELIVSRGFVGNIKSRRRSRNSPGEKSSTRFFPILAKAC